VGLDFALRQVLGERPLTTAGRLLLLSATLASPARLAAQSAPPVLPPTREEVTRPQPPLTPPPGARIEVEGGLERPPCALDAPEFAAIRFTPRAVEFEGLQGLSAADLAPAYVPYIGHDQPISVVCEVRDRAAAILSDAGYIAAVEVPEQRIADGVIRFRVVMAHLTQVRVRGDAIGAERIIGGYLGQLTKESVFNRYDAERYLLLATDLPGYTVRLALRPAGTTAGEVIGDVTVERTTAYADFNIQNGGSRELGRWGGLLRGQFFGLTGLGDRTTLALFSTSDFKEQQTVQVGHDFRLGSQGLSLSGMFTYGWAKPSIPDAHVLARTLLATVEADYPFVRRQSHNLRGAIGMDVINQNVRLDGNPFSRDRLRVGFARLGFDAISSDISGPGRSLAEPPWQFNALLELRQGLNILGASDFCGLNACLGPLDVPPSRPEGHPTATVLRYSAYGEVRPIPKLTFALGARGQYAWKPVLSFEEYSAGNYTVGRGYDPGALLGDRGFGTQAEIRFGSRIPVNARKAAFEGYVFWDYTDVRNLGRLVLSAGTQHLNSVGGGARINFDRFALDAALAVPLTHVGLPAERPDPRLLVSLTSRLFPWTYR
jgi:hemolysin activation/secretion protein